MDGKRFGDLIAIKRKEKDYSLQKVSNLTGGRITPSYISRLESKEKKNPSFDMVCQLSEALELDMKKVFESFGYENLFPTPNHESRPQQDILVTDQEGNSFVIECKSIAHMNNNQRELLGQAVNEIIYLPYLKDGEIFGTLSRILSLAEKMIEEERSKKLI